MTLVLLRQGCPYKTQGPNLGRKRSPWPCRLRRCLPSARLLRGRGLRSPPALSDALEEAHFALNQLRDNLQDPVWHKASGRLELILG